MELVLVRTYHGDGTNGILRQTSLRQAQTDRRPGSTDPKAKGAGQESVQNNKFICYTIELPWEDNLPQHLCKPEGRYELKKRYSSRFGKHYWQPESPPGDSSYKDRSLILIHPANDALKELRGCIAPVSILTGPGKSILSRNAFEKLVTMVYQALRSETVFFNHSMKSK